MTGEGAGPAESEKEDVVARHRRIEAALASLSIEDIRELLREIEEAIRARSEETRNRPHGNARAASRESPARPPVLS